MWGTEDDPVIQPKTKGAGIMVSDFIEQHSGFLRLTDDELKLARSTTPTFPEAARCLLEYGAEREGYWTGEHFISNVESAARIAEFKYPKEKCSVVFLFDQSSCHQAYAEDRLNAKKLNVKPGGAQPAMRDTVWGGKPQKLVDENGVPKGMKKVLEERGINTIKMKADDMRIVLSHHYDFLAEKTIVEDFL